MVGGRSIIGTAVVSCRIVLGQSSKEDVGDKRAFEAVCGSCHTAGLVAGFRSEPEWVETVQQMVRLGARASDEQFDRLMRFLLRTWTKVKINSATAPEIAPVLDIGDAAAEAVVKRRTELGSFKSLDQLKKIPGLNPAKLEARKDRIIF